MKRSPRKRGMSSAAARRRDAVAPSRTSKTAGKTSATTRAVVTHVAPKSKERLDLTLVARGLSESREKAARLILAGQVLVNGQPLDKAGALVDKAALVQVTAGQRFVSRGGEKLGPALDAFGVSPRGRMCLDVGASTGGFTQCLLERGATRVYAVDVGQGQLDARLRSDARVVVMEKTNARYLVPSLFADAPELATVDVAFISLEKVLPAIQSVLTREGEAVALVKPQFEVGRGRVGKGGVVRDPALRAEAVADVRGAALRLGLAVRGEAESVLPGPKGNREVFLWLACPAR